jgi:hypothetical protein
LARDFDFDGELLVRAIRATFQRRNTPLPTSRPVALSQAFAEDGTKKTQWAGFVRKSGVSEVGSLAETVAAVRAFVETPLAEAAHERVAHPRLQWRAGGAWESTAE